MKKTKKYLSIMLSIVMALSLSLVGVATQSEVKSSLNEEFITQEIVDRDREIVEQMIIEGEAISRTKASKTLSVSLLKQTDSKWEDTEMPCYETCSHTYGPVGCAMTSYAMIADFYNKNNLNTPPEFGQAYYDEHGNTCDQAATSAAKLMDKVARGTWDLTNEEVINFCIASINSGKPAMIRVDKGGSHYVVAYGYSGDTIKIRDPAYDRNELSDYFADSSVIALVSIG